MSAGAAAPSAGLFNSYKGFGLSFMREGKDRQDYSFTLIADIYGLPSGTVEKPGIKGNFSRIYMMDLIPAGFADVRIYAGPGISVGYVHDRGKGNPGFVGALSGTAGLHADFGRNISLQFGFTAEFGLHYRTDERFDIKDLSFYKNGIFESLYPELTIYFKL